METLYRKVAVSERKPNKGGQYFTDKNLVNYLTNGQWHHIRDPHTEFPEWWLEEIPNTTAQLEADNIANTFLKPYEKEFLDCLEKLQADKEELLKALEKATDLLEAGFPEISAVKDFQSLIQKHKQ